jgi:hypothetical protein
MEPNYSKEEALQNIKKGFEDAEEAIWCHSDEIIEIYKTAVAAFRESQNNIEENSEVQEILNSTSLTLDEIKIVRNYLVAMSFIAAWYHLNGDTINRDKTAHSASIVASSSGLNPENTFLTFVQYEQLWRATLSVKKNKKTGCLVLLVTIIAVGTSLILAMML